MCILFISQNLLHLESTPIPVKRDFLSKNYDIYSYETIPFHEERGRRGVQVGRGEVFSGEISIGMESGEGRRALDW